MKTKILIVLLTILFISSLIYAQTQIKGGEIQRGTPQIQRGTQISDEPVIREFSLNPTFWLQGQSGEITFSWRVEPSPGGTPITRITITKTSGNGPAINFSSSDSQGQYKLTIPSSLGQGRTTYALTAVNQAGRTKTQTVDFEVNTLDNLRTQISITDVRSNPVEFESTLFGMAAPTPADFTITVNNRSGVTISGVKVVMQTCGVASPFGGALCGEGHGSYKTVLQNQTIRPGINTFTFRDDAGWTKKVILTLGRRPFPEDDYIAYRVLDLVKSREVIYFRYQLGM
jgi:hypothetical protein